VIRRSWERQGREKASRRGFRGGGTDCCQVGVGDGENQYKEVGLSLGQTSSGKSHRKIEPVNERVLEVPARGERGEKQGRGSLYLWRRPEGGDIMRGPPRKTEN